MSIFRSTDSQFIQQEVRNFFFDSRVFNESKIIVGWHRAFIAFLKNCFDAVALDSVIDYLCNIFLCLKGIVGILNVDNRFA